MKRYNIFADECEDSDGRWVEFSEVDPIIAALQKKIEEYEKFENNVKSMALEKEVSDDHILAENEELKKKLKECEQKIEELEYRYARGAGGGLSGQ
jgi:Zn-finger nucleic acid-binding protein